MRKNLDPLFKMHKLGLSYVLECTLERKNSPQMLSLSALRLTTVPFCDWCVGYIPHSTPPTPKKIPSRYLTHFWHYLPGDSVRFHNRSPSDTNHKFSVVTHVSQPTTNLPFINLLRHITESRETFTGLLTMLLPWMQKHILVRRWMWAVWAGGGDERASRSLRTCHSLSASLCSPAWKLIRS